jgi:26S proteasome regulatory subunit N2
MSNLADEGKLPTPVGKETEPAFELRPNFSRVTPAQMAYVSFPEDCRYQPVRPVSAHSDPRRAAKAESVSWSINTASERYGGGGGILILVDTRPEVEGQFIEFETSTQFTTADVANSTPNNQVATSASLGPYIALDESAPEASLPEPFEVRFLISYSSTTHAHHDFPSIRLIMTVDVH